MTTIGSPFIASNSSGRSALKSYCTTAYALRRQLVNSSRSKMTNGALFPLAAAADPPAVAALIGGDGPVGGRMFCDGGCAGALWLIVGVCDRLVE